MGTVKETVQLNFQKRDTYSKEKDSGIFQSQRIKRIINYVLPDVYRLCNRFLCEEDTRCGAKGNNVQKNFAKSDNFVKIGEYGKVLIIKYGRQIYEGSLCDSLYFCVTLKVFTIKKFFKNCLAII